MLMTHNISHLMHETFLQKLSYKMNDFKAMIELSSTQLLCTLVLFGRPTLWLIIPNHNCNHVISPYYNNHIHVITMQLVFQLSLCPNFSSET